MTYDYEKILKELKPFKGKYIYCIKDYNCGNNHFRESLYNYQIDKCFYKGEFYLLHGIRYSSERDSRRDVMNIIGINITMTKDIYSEFHAFEYEHFIEHFELITLPDLRKRKIKSILK